MTLDEAKQLKPGDRVLVEMEIQEVLESSVFLSSEYADFSNIREKIAPQRRKFRKGDIVWYRNTFFRVLNDSDGVSVYIAECGADVNPWNEWLVVSPGNIQLVSSVEDREDRKEDA